MTYIGTAVNTNIALLLKTFPEIKEHIEKIVLMGGSINEGNSTPQGSKYFKLLIIVIIKLNIIFIWIQRQQKLFLHQESL